MTRILATLLIVLVLVAACGPAWKYRVSDWDDLSQLHYYEYYCYDRSGGGGGGWYTGAEIKNQMYSKCALRCSEPRPMPRQEVCR